MRWPSTLPSARPCPAPPNQSPPTHHGGGLAMEGNYEGEEMKEAGPMVLKVLLLLNYP